MSTESGTSTFPTTTQDIYPFQSIGSNNCVSVFEDALVLIWIVAIVSFAIICISTMIAHQITRNETKAAMTKKFAWIISNVSPSSASTTVSSTDINNVATSGMNKNTVDKFEKMTDSMIIVTRKDTKDVDVGDEIH